ncbi:MAG: hypothetical protein ACRDN1_07085 [Trebonia sp.]
MGTTGVVGSTTGVVGSTTGDVGGAEDLGAVACVDLDPLLDGCALVEDADALDAPAAGCVCFATVFAFFADVFAFFAEEVACEGAAVAADDALPAGVAFSDSTIPAATSRTARPPITTAATTASRAPLPPALRAGPSLLNLISISSLYE